MTPEQKVKWLILSEMSDDIIPYSCEAIAALMADIKEDDALYDEYCEAREELRTSGIPTGLPSPYSRHYEAYEVAARLPDGSWVGWTYWYGGGKHGEPESIDWIEYAYDVNCYEAEKMMVVRTFTKTEVINDL